MATLIELYQDVKRLEKEAKTAKHVHKLRKTKIWLRITKIREKQDEMLFSGVNSKTVLDFVQKEWDDCFKQLENEYSRYREERKRMRQEYERKMKQLSDIINELSPR